MNYALIGAFCALLISGCVLALVPSPGYVRGLFGLALVAVAATLMVRNDGLRFRIQ